MKSKIQNQKSKIIVYLVAICLLIIELMGCDAFVRKFTRKKKIKDLPREELVLTPEEYKGPQMSKEELYRQYFLFWKSWQDELITYLTPGANHKKQLNCAEQAIKNLQLLRGMLKEEKQKKLDIYIDQLINLKNLIKQDLYGTGITTNRSTAERIKMNIQRYFDYPKIKDCLL